jgi:cobalt/nickel transport system permease protein
VFEWLQGDPVNGILMTVAFFTFLIIGRELRLRQNRRKKQTQARASSGSLNLQLSTDVSASVLHRLDARVRFLCAIVAVFAAVALTNLYYLLIPIVVSAVLVLISRDSIFSYFKRLSAAVLVALLIAVVQFFSGTHIVYAIPYLGWNIYQEGIAFGLLILMRVLAAASILNLLITITTMESLMNSLAWFRLPSVLIDTMMLMYRYISVVNEEKARIFKAQQSRCGYTKTVGVFRKLSNYGTVGGMLLVKSFDRALQVGNAMVSRGYTGTSSLFDYNQAPLSRKNIGLCVVIIGATVALVLLNYNII